MHRPPVEARQLERGVSVPRLTEVYAIADALGVEDLRKYGAE